MVSVTRPDGSGPQDQNGGQQSALLKQLKATGAGLKALRQPYDSLFGELADFYSSRRGRFSSGETRSYQNLTNLRVVNPRGRLALRTLQNGMQTGMTSPARPWFRLAPRDPSLAQDAAVMRHLQGAQKEIGQLMQRSGIYDMLHTGWSHLGLYGVECGLIEDDVERGLYGRELVPGTYWLGTNSYGMVDTLYREFMLDVQQMVHKFVYRGDPRNEPDWDAVSAVVKRDWEKGDHGATHRVHHLIAPRYNRDPRSALPKDKPIMSVYWQPEQQRRVALDSGYDVSPISASRWDAEGIEVYGGSPAMDALPTVKRLQVKERDLAEAERRMNRPAMNAPSEWRNGAFSFDPESVNFVNDPQRGAVPAFLVQPPIEEMRQQIRELEQDIDDTMYASLFMMIANLDRRQITAREIDERHEEKMIELGPVLERQHREKLAPLIARCYDKVMDEGKVEPLPEQYAGMDIAVEYISMLAQAQKAMMTGGLERLVAYVGGLAGANPEALDKLDMDASIDEYAEAIGAPAAVLRSVEEVTALREKRAAQQAQQEQMATMQAGAETARTGADAARLMAETDAASPNSPRNILRVLGIGA